MLRCYKPLLQEIKLMKPANGAGLLHIHTVDSFANYVPRRIVERTNLAKAQNLAVRDLRFQDSNYLYSRNENIIIKISPSIQALVDKEKLQLINTKDATVRKILDKFIHWKIMKTNFSADLDFEFQALELVLNFVVEDEKEKLNALMQS